MVTEIAQIDVKPGLEAEFEALCAEAQALVLGRLTGRTC